MSEPLPVTYHVVSTHKIAVVGEGTNTAFQTHELASLTPRATYLQSLTGASDTYTWSSMFSGVTESNGNATVIEDYSPWQDFVSGDGGYLDWKWATGEKVYKRTLLIDSVGTTEEAVRATLEDDGEFFTAIGDSAFTSTYYATTSTATTMQGWQTTEQTFSGRATTTSSRTLQAQTTAGSPPSFVSTAITQSFLTTKSASATRITTTNESIATTLTGKEYLATASTAHGNTLLAKNTLTDASAWTQTSWAEQTTQSLSRDVAKWRRTYFGSIPFSIAPQGMTTYDGGNSGFEFNATNEPVAGTVFTFDGQTTISSTFSETTTKTDLEASIQPLANNVPMRSTGTVVTTTQGTYYQTTTSAQTGFGLAITSSSTTLSRVEKVNWALAEATTFSTEAVTRKIEDLVSGQLGFNDEEGFTAEYVPRGFSFSTSGVVDIDGYSNSVTISTQAESVNVIGTTGFVSAATPIANTFIATASFGARTGNAYGKAILADFINEVPEFSRSVFFAAQAPHVYGPVTGSGRNSDNGFFTYKHTDITTAESGETSSAEFSLIGSPDEFWVGDSRLRLPNQPFGIPVAEPASHPAFIAAGQGAKRIEQGVYFTYGATASGLSFAAGNAPIRYTDEDAPVTAYRPATYYTTNYVNTLDWLNDQAETAQLSQARTTKAFYGNDLTSPILDD